MSRKEEDFVRDWLAGSGSREDVEKKVQEAVFILSPKHAPLPQKTLDHVFSTLRGGPLASLPEDEVHEDVKFLFSGAKKTEALPKGDISSVLHELKEGPLSIPREFPKENSNVIPLRRRWSVWGTVIAAAAVLLLLVQPVLQNPMMMTSYQESDRSADSKSVLLQEYISEPIAYEEEPEDEVAESPSPVVAKKEKVKKSSQPPSPSKRTAQKQREINRRKAPKPETKREQKDSMLDVMADEEMIVLEEKKVVVESEESERVASVQEELVKKGREELLERGSTQESAQAVEPVPTKSRKEADTLSILRAEALRDEKISRHPPFAYLGKDALISITQQADMQKLYWAAYEIAIRFPQERNHIESLLRLKTTPSLEQKHLFILLGDMYRTEGNLGRAQQAYRRALKVK